MCKRGQQLSKRKLASVVSNRKMRICVLYPKSVALGLAWKTPGFHPKETQQKPFCCYNPLKHIKGKDS